MAVAFDAATAAAATSLSHTTSGTNRCLFVIISTNNTNVPTVTYNSVSMTVLGSSTDGGAGLGATHLFRLVAPDLGANTVATSGGNVDYIVAASFTGVHQTTPNGTVASTNGTTPTSPSGVSPTGAVAGDMKVGGYSITDSAETLTATGCTALATAGGSSRKGIGLRGTNTQFLDTTATNQTGDWSGVGVVVKQTDTWRKNLALLGVG